MMAPNTAVDTDMEGISNAAYSKDIYGIEETSFGETVRTTKMSSKEPEVELRWENVYATAGSGDDVKTIINNLSGSVRQGSMTAIMGSSGAGKSTFMNILTQRNIGGLKIKGDITVNGIHVKEEITKLSGYIQQNDVFVGALTVEEHLFLQAKLRLSKESKTRQEDRIQEVVKLMGLQNCYKTVIGTPGLSKTISGGEMKRLSIAAEILTDPPIIFADEPTSGLDSYLALAVVNTLKDLASHGSTILCTIHQPNSEIFNTFDSLLLLSMGRCAYMGEVDAAIKYFKELGFPCKENYNPADHYIMNLSIMEGREEECKNKIDYICEQYIESSYFRDLQKEARTVNEDLVQDKIEQYDRNSVSFLVSFWWLLWRALLAQYRDKTTLGMKFGQNLGTGIIIGLVYLRIPWDNRENPYTNTDAFNINGGIFSLTCSFSFAYLFLVVFSFPRMKVILRREYYDGLYKVATAFMAEVVAGLPFILTMPFLFVGIVYCMIGFSPGWLTYISIYCTCILIALCSSGYGYFISALAPTIEAANAIAPPLMVPLLLFGGFFLQSETVPIYFIWMKYISWFYYGAENLYVTQWQNSGACYEANAMKSLITAACSQLSDQGITADNCKPRDYIGDKICTCLQADACAVEEPEILYNYLTGDDILKPFSYNPDYYWRNVGCMITLAVGFRFVGYLVLAFKFRKANR